MNLDLFLFASKRSQREHSIINTIDKTYKEIFAFRLENFRLTLTNLLAMMGNYSFFWLLSSQFMIFIMHEISFAGRHKMEDWFELRNAKYNI